MNTPVSSPLPKLLKEKGFDEQWNIYMYTPTISEVVMWLYEKHGIWVYCEITKDKFYVKAKKLKSNYRRVVSGIQDNEIILYDSPTEAYEAAIEFTLINIIK